MSANAEIGVYVECELPHTPAEALWTLTATTHGAYRIEPDGCSDIVVRFSGSHRDVLIAGAATRTECVDVSPGETFAGLRFRPGEAGVALGLAARELTNTTLPLDDVAPGLAKRFDAIADIRGAEAILRELASRPRQRLPKRVFEAVRILRASHGDVRMRELASHVGVSERTLHRDILEHVGMAPKQLARVFRFRHAVRLRGPLADVALQAGFADQAHMTREFVALGGVPPSRGR